MSRHQRVFQLGAVWRPNIVLITWTSGLPAHYSINILHGAPRNIYLQNVASLGCLSCLWRYYISTGLQSIGSWVPHPRARSGLSLGRPSSLFHHSCAQFSLNNVHKGSLKHKGGRRSPAVACWASDHWVASSNSLRGKFRHSFRLIIPGVCLAQFSLNNVHKRGLKHHHFIFLKT